MTRDRHAPSCSDPTNEAMRDMSVRLRPRDQLCPALEVCATGRLCGGAAVQGVLDAGGSNGSQGAQMSALKRITGAQLGHRAMEIWIAGSFASRHSLRLRCIQRKKLVEHAAHNLVALACRFFETCSINLDQTPPIGSDGT
jgi:hypothetical protein